MREYIIKIVYIMAALSLMAPMASAVTSVEIRGVISNEGAPNYEWNASTFPAFWYDLKNDFRSESLTIDSGESLTSSDRVLDKNHLVYTMQRVLKKYKVYSNKGLNVKNALDSSGDVVSNGTRYGLVGFLGRRKLQWGVMQVK